MQNIETKRIRTLALLGHSGSGKTSLAEARKETDYIAIPSYCPVCEAYTKIVKDNDSMVLVCTNNNCSGKMIGKFNHFVSRKAMNIEGMSEATLEALISNNFIHNYIDIYHLQDHKNELVQLERFGEKSILNMLKSIEKSRKNVYNRFQDGK